MQLPANMSKNAARLFARSKQDFQALRKTDVGGMCNCYEGHLFDRFEFHNEAVTGG